MSSVEARDYIHKAAEEKAADGYIIHAAVISKELDEMIFQESIPHLVIGNPNFTSHFCWIDIDNRLAGELAATHLLEQGCDKVIVVLTGSVHARPTDYTRLRPLLRQLYAKKYPMLYHAVLHRIARYEEQVHALEQAQRKQRALVLRPQVKSIPLFTQNEDKIRAYYQHGCELVDQRWTEITAFLESRTLTQ